MIGNVSISEVQAVASSQQVMESRPARWKLFDTPPPDTPEPVVITSPTDLSFPGVDHLPGTTIIIIEPGRGDIFVLPDSVKTIDILCHWFHRCPRSR